ncbi:GTP cyclohydrolase I [Mycobacterium ulcerans]|uniref:GTP cyclohydrolase I n=1 Tax=Mycobacterium ulcerans TaxID=1809 RepID=UPI001E58ABB1|nr:GTP cyclohydrolase I [Mycobacterium ulcerans]MEB3969471.1 GTP cyclohydrolase I [Mycobacterium ulcerans]MEB3977791.1 GTP cyclohydrolase I [Mycobacterium ulcerans]MEB4007039.1 GTP cyclohydrolase I [Mycobacterium ulcerans]MEB4416668.1 GTP cyclohydrolase I [Mycobacterium ulcerans]MEB4434818.1 GTP cyclohydrolase I [Mycobacterium ulcerans]
MPSAPHQGRYQMPPLRPSAWQMTNDGVAYGAASYHPNSGYPHSGRRPMNSPAWYDNNPDLAVECAVQQLLDALGVDDGEHPPGRPRASHERGERCCGDITRYRRTRLATDFPAPDDPGLIVMHGISFSSTCPHHLLPFTGTATIAYRPHPGQRIVGLSKLARLVDGYAARLQVQERIGQQAVDGIMRRLNPSGAMCIITARHDCMRLRGVRDPAAEATTEARKGIWSDHEMALIHRLHGGAR